MPAKQQKPSTATTATSASAILHSAFTPSTSQWSLFASVIQGLDAQRIRIHDVASHRLVCEHAVAPKELVTSLDWGYLATTTTGSANASAGASESASAKKKRRRSSSTANAVAATSSEAQEELVLALAFGTSTGDVRIFSPAQDRIVTVLKSQGPAAIVDAKFTAPAAPATASTELWSVASDGKLSRWDLTTAGSAKLVRSLALPTSSVSTLARPVGSNPPVLVASQTPFLVSVGEEAKGEKAEGVTSFAAMRNSIHTLLASSTTKLGDAQFLAADADRYVNLFDVERKKLLGNLVAAKEVERLALYVPQQQKKGKQTQQQQQTQTQVLAAVTRGGAVEFFTHPFTTNQQLLQQQTQQQQGQHSQASLKALRKSQTRRAAATLVLRRPNGSAPINVIAAGFTGDGDLLVVYVEGGVNPVFERVRVLEGETGEMAWTGVKEIVRAKSSAGGALGGVIDAGVNGVAGKEVRVDESRTVVESGVGGGVDMDVDEEQEKEGKEESENEDMGDAEEKKDTEMMDVDQQENEGEKEEEDPNAEPSFGDLVKQQEVVDVEAALATPAPQKQSAGPNTPTPRALVTGKTGNLSQLTHPTSKATAITSNSTTTASAPTSASTSGVTLANVLTQALRTNDTTLLESCFHTADTTIVRATIQRIDSALAAPLLSRLAERLSTRPGRYGHLLVWVQWTCVAHGGSIAEKPELLRQVVELFKVMEQRSASLSPLLMLKGKLDMLDAQLGLRRALVRAGEEKRKITGGQGQGQGVDEEEEGVIYVEGMDDEVDSDGEDRLLIEEARTGATPAAKKGGARRKRDAREAGLDDADGLGSGADSEDEEQSSGDEDMPLTVNGVGSDESDNEEGSDDEDLLDREAEVSDEDESEDEEEDDDEGSEGMEGFIDDESEEEVEEVKPKKSAKKGKGGRR